MPLSPLLLASLVLPVALQAPTTLVPSGLAPSGLNPTTGLPITPEFDAGPAFAEQKQEVRSHDFRLNSFTDSSQDNVSLGAAPDGSIIAVWHSRRQEGGTYGVRARRMNEDGEFLSEEVSVNETSKGMQVEPSVSLDPSGAAWFAWVSRGQDGSGDGVYARRFSGKLDAASAEVRVDSVFEGDQSEPSIVALADGRALCTWTGPAEADGAEVVRGRRALYARFLAPDGQPDGDKFELEVPGDLGLRTPTTAALDGWAIVAASTYDSMGRPAGIFLFEVDASQDASGATPKEAPSNGQAKTLLRTLPGVRVDGGQEGTLPVEPSLSATQGRAAIAWLEADTAKSGGEYSIRWRSLPARVASKKAVAKTKKASLTRVEPGTIHGVDAPESGYTSGLAIAVRGADTALIWSRHLKDENGTPRLYSHVVRGESAADEGALVSLMDARHATEAENGKQAMAVGGAGQRAQFTTNGRLAAVWHGDADLGDSSGAHLTLLMLEQDDRLPRVLADAAPKMHGAAAAAPVTMPNWLTKSVAPLRADDASRTGDAAPAPHEVPTFNRKDVEPLDLHDVVRRSSLSGTNLDFRAFSSTGWTPPDPEMAVGTTHIVAIVNGGIRFFDKQGTLLFNDQIEGSGGFWGAQGATGFVFDPEVVWDPHTNRFVAIAAERDGNLSYYLLAISDDADPNGTWAKYRLNVTPIIGNNIDSVNLSVDSQAIYLTADFFSPTRYFIYIVDKASVLNGGTAVTTNTTIFGSHSMGAPVNYDANADSAYFIFAPESFTSNSIEIYAVNDPLGSPAVQQVTVSVPTYNQPTNPPQMGTSNRPELFEARFWSAVLRNGKLWATHHQGSPARQRWYEFDLAGWPQSGQAPTLVQSGEIDAGPDVSTFFGSLWVNDAGAMAMTFAMSSASSFISMVRTTRGAADPLGTTAGLDTVITSTSPETSGRWGDYSATNDDPAAPGTFWGHHEYRESGWRTRIASFDACSGSIDNYCVTSPNSVGSGATIQASGSLSLADNSIQLETIGSAPGTFGVFFHGDARDLAPTGDGVRCVGGNIFRLGVVQSDIFGRSFFDLDVTMPSTPAALITAGSTWNFQYFYRDIVPMGSGLNFSDAVAIQFCD